MHPIRVLLVDDHDLVRAGVGALLRNSPDIIIVGEAGNGVEAIEFVEDNTPDVVLMDIIMPGLNGLDATARLTAKNRGVRVVILSMLTTDECVAQALRNGAVGYLQKTVGPDELILAIKSVMLGKFFLGSNISQRLAMSDTISKDFDSSSLGLTSRQREVLQLVAEGYRTKEIAIKLGVSTKTIEMHRAQTMQSLGIHDIPGLVRYAIRAGLISV